jgi:hypothetical protein
MNGYITAGAAILAGILICFWGYRMLKVTLGITGAIFGASSGWALGLSVAPNSAGVALVCAVVGALIGAALCIWLFFLGIFLIGASAGTAIASAVFNASGHQPAPLIVLVVAVVFGVIALAVQKFMIVISTAFSGSYLLLAGILPLVSNGPSAAPLWVDPFQRGPTGALGMGALIFWAVVGVAGAAFQFREGRRREELAREQTQAA